MFTLVLTLAQIAQPLDPFKSHQVIKPPPAHRVRAVAFSPDGKLLAAGWEGNSVALVDPTTGRTLAHFKGHAGDVVSIEFSPDSKRVATVDEATVGMWDAARAERTAKLDLPKCARALFIGDDRIATAEDSGIIRLWSADGKEIRKLDGHAGKVTDLAVFPGGKTLVSSSKDGSVRFWDVESGRETGQFRSDRVKEYLSVAASPDGNFVLGLGKGEPPRFDPTGHLATEWDVAAAKKRRDQDLAISGRPIYARYAPDGLRVAFAGRDGVRLYSTSTWKLLEDPIGAGSACVAFSSGILASVESDGVRLVEPKTGRTLRCFESAAQYVASVAFAADGRSVFVAGGNRAIERVDLDTGQTIARFDGDYGRIRAIALSDSTLASSGGAGTLQLWNVGRGAPRISIRCAAERICFSPRGTLLAAAEGRAVRLWDPATGRQVRALEGHRDPISGVVFSPDGAWLATSSDRLRIWNARTGKLLFENIAESESDLGVSRDGRTLWLTIDGRTIAIDSRTGESIRSFPLSRFVAASPVNRLVALEQGSAIRLIDLHDPHTFTVLASRDHPVTCAAFSPRGDRIVAGTVGGKVHVWDISGVSPRRIADRPGAESVESIASRENVVEFVRPWFEGRGPDSDELRRMFSDLDDDDPHARDRAHERLERMDDLAESELRARLERAPDDEMRGRILTLLDRLEDPIVKDADARRRLRAVHALELHGSPACLEFLRELAANSIWGRVRRDARAALDRLQNR
jgi:WD40 repeat protein